MPITIIVRHGAGEDTRLTFDGTQRVVIGRGPGSDVRLPDASVSHRHATLRGQGSDFVLVDEGSTNGTFVGAVRIAARTSRLVRSGDTVRVGRVVLELRIDQSPVTRDVAVATRDLALALVSQAMAAMGTDRTPKVRVVEGRNQGAVLALARDEHPYLIGRAPHCDLLLDDPDSSREHLWVIARGDSIFLRDRAAMNGTFIGEVRAPEDREVLWRPAIMVRIGRTVLALEDPITSALADLERVEDEPVRVEDEPALSSPPDGATADAPVAGNLAMSAGPAAATPLASVPSPASRRPKEKARWSVADLLVMAAALSVLALSLVGLVWLLHG